MIKKHSIIVCVGPSGCGKSTFVKQLNAVVISTDDIRRKLICENLVIGHKKAEEASQQAFDWLYTEVNLRSQFPINNPYIVVDSTGLQKDFRDKIKSIADENNYNFYLLMFVYKNRDHYFMTNRPATSRHVKKLFEELGNMGKVNKIKVISPFDRPTELNNLYKDHEYNI